MNLIPCLKERHREMKLSSAALFYALGLGKFRLNVNE